MSQKTSRRTRRQTTDEDTASLKSRAAKLNGDDETQSIDGDSIKSAKSDLNGGENRLEKGKNGTDNKETEEVRVTRRSLTPQKKREEKNATTNNGHDLEKVPEEKEKEKDVEVAEKDNPATEPEAAEAIEMDPLAVVSDEPDPELVFEENSDLESGKDSPVLSRCTTRRGSARNIPTPKTPKLDENPTPSPILEMETETATGENNASFESCSENMSTKAQVGGDSTRIDFIDKDSSSVDSNSFLASAKDKSFGEALRHLSTRRSIRPLGEDYRKRVLQKNNELNLSYPSRQSVERVSVGTKRRKSSSEPSESSKRFKSDSPGFFTRFTSPLMSIRNSFRSEAVSSTPKLTGYKDEKFLLEDGANSKLSEVKDGERRWCSIM